jgi:transketolase
MQGFGASARADVLYRHFGITEDRIMETARILTGKQVA